MSKFFFHVSEDFPIIAMVIKISISSKSLVGAECWYAAVVCVMCDVSQLYHVFKTTVCLNSTLIEFEKRHINQK